MSVISVALAKNVENLAIEMDAPEVNQTLAKKAVKDYMEDADRKIRYALDCGASCVFLSISDIPFKKGQYGEVDVITQAAVAKEVYNQLKNLGYTVKFTQSSEGSTFGSDHYPEIIISGWSS